jgi:hypothetical protein
MVEQRGLKKTAEYRNVSARFLARMIGGARQPRYCATRLFKRNRGRRHTERCPRGLTTAPRHPAFQPEIRAGARSERCEAGELIRYFDRISADGLDRLFTVRKLSKDLRFEEGLCLLKTVPLCESHAFGWGWSLHTDNLTAAGAEIPTSRFRLCSLGSLKKAPMPDSVLVNDSQLAGARYARTQGAG